MDLRPRGGHKSRPTLTLVHGTPTLREDALSIFGLVIAVVILGMKLYLIGKLAF
jgi:hypothetical protein